MTTTDTSIDMEGYIMRSLLIDDVRDIKATVIARTYNDGIIALKTQGPFDVLYLDHDLASYDEKGVEKNGYHILCFLEEFPEYLPKRIELVTANPIGRRRMSQVIDKLYGRF